MLEQAFLGGLVVIGGDLQRTVSPGLFRVLGEVNGFAGGIAASAGQDFYFASGELYGEPDDVDVLFVVDGRGLARGADGHDAVHAGVDLDLDKPLQRSFIKVAVLKRGNNCSVSSREHQTSLWSHLRL